MAVYGRWDKKATGLLHPSFLKKKKWVEADMKKVEEGGKAEQRSKTHCWAQKDGVSSEVVKHCTFFKSPLPSNPNQETDSRGVGQGEECAVGRSRVIVRYVSSAPRLAGDVEKKKKSN